MRQTPLFTNIQTGEAVYDDAKASYKGIGIKTGIYLLIAISVAATIYFALPNIITTGNLPVFYTIMFIGLIVGFITAIIGRVSYRAAKYCGVIYSLSEGLFLGAISYVAQDWLNYLDFKVPVVAIALGSTLLIFGAMLVLFMTGVTRHGTIMRRIMIALFVGLIAILPLMIIAYFFVTDFKTYLGIMIAVEAFLLLYGAITLTFNFSEAQAVVDSGCSKRDEWSVALGITISLVYIYIEIVRLIILIASLAGRNK